MKHSQRIAIALLAAAVFTIPAFAQEDAEAQTNAVPAELAPAEKSDFGRWYLSPGVGLVKFEGDEALKDGMYLTIRLGYDYNEFWSFEGSFVYAPKLNERTGGYKYKDDDGVWRDHDVPFYYGKRQGGAYAFGDTYMLQLYGDALFHFTRFEYFDPYLTFGAGATLYGEDINSSGPFSATLRVGGGVMYHLSDSWTLRADARVNIAGYNTEFNMTADIGFVYRFSADLIKDDPTR